MTSIPQLRYAHITYDSRVNGPGLRNVLHLQGCTIGCKGCFNTHTWSKKAGKVEGAYKLCFELTKNTPTGITISGGEPTEQWSSLRMLLREAHKRLPELDVLMFTGLTEEQLAADGILEEAFAPYYLSSKLISTIVCGPYQEDNPSQEYLLGSTNQKILTWNGEPIKREGPRVEIKVGRDGVAIITGFPNGEVLKNIKLNFRKTE